jgi:coniferyl-aldehyde dehydrogenase
MSTVAEVRSTYERLLKGYRGNLNPTAEQREDRLDRLERLLMARADEFATAASEDFGGRSRHETLLADVVLTLDAVRVARKRVRQWMKPKSADVNPFFRPSAAYVETVPLGVVGVIAPWNYPVNLALGPLAAALAAGNRVLLKPSEVTPRVSALLASSLRDTFTAEEVGVVEGGPDVARAVTELPLDHLLFTGSTRIGKLVAKAAAENLVPVTLELGGKSPALVMPDYPVAQAADRLAVGKLFNAGQTCIAPDYVLLPRGKEGVFVEAFSDAVKERFGDPMRSPDFSALVSERDVRRAKELVQEAREGGARVVELGTLQEGSRRWPPTLVLGAKPGMRLLEEEIFMPILPLVAYDSLSEALEFVRARPRPLAFYCFDENIDRARNTVSQVVSGGAVVNDTLMHFAQEHLPFGGVGASGMGRYHGEAGFLTFSHQRGVLVSSPLSAARKVLAPPYGKLMDGAVKAVLGVVGRFLA